MVFALAAGFPLGLLTAVAVALLFAWRPFPDLQDAGYGARPIPLTQSFSVSDQRWDVWQRAAPGLRTKQFRVSIWRSAGPAEQVRNFDEITSDSACLAALKRHEPILHTRDANFCSFAILYFGWPFPCLSYEKACSQLEISLARAMVIDSRDPGAWSADPSNNLKSHYYAIEWKTHVLPLRPAWPELLADAAIYSLPWGALSFLALSVWSYLRRARGLCTACGYSLVGLPADTLCPECGLPAPILRA
jgi:hypothetical protein